MNFFEYIGSVLGIKLQSRGGSVAAQRTPSTEDSPSTVREGGAPLWQMGQDSAKSVSTVYACVKLLSEAVANLCVNFVRQDAAGVSHIDRSDRLWYLLNVAPSGWLSGFDLKSRIVDDLLLWGNAYIVPIFNVARGDWERLAIVRPWCVSHDTINDTYTINDIEEGVSGTFDECEVVHIKNTGPNPKYGLSVLGYARLSIAIGRSGDLEAKNRTDDGGAVKGVLSNDRTMRGVGKYQDEQLQFAAIDMDKQFREGRRIVHVPGTVEFKQLSMSSADMQFLESRKFAVQDICRFFNVPPSFVTGEGNSAYKSASESLNMFLITTLNPLLRKIENELNRKLLSAGEMARGKRIEFDRRDIFACDIDGRLRHLAAMQQMGAATVNEVRQLCGRGKVEGGDRLLVSANLRDINELKQTDESNGD